MNSFLIIVNFNSQQLNGGGWGEVLTASFILYAAGGGGRRYGGNSPATAKVWGCVVRWEIILGGICPGRL